MTILMLNGELIAAETATLPATDRALTHGLGLYETLKLVGGVPVFFEEHVARLDLGLDELGLERPCSRAEMAAQICRLSVAGDVPDGACRVLVTAGPPHGKPGLLIQADRRRFPARPLIVISYLGVRVRAQLKAMTVMQSYLAQRAATAAGADDAILVDDEGHIFEGATSNMFLVRGGGLVTPPAEGAILPGVLRAKVEELAGAHGIPVVEAFARVADLRSDDGMLLTSSVRGIVPVRSVDDHELRVDEALLGQLRSLVGTAEAASTDAFRTSYR
jgi:branched-subunit amino acid aminotransferase/4-amino-4-deoxychorismate lyase